MILATVCAREGSKGVPKKNIKRLCGIPLIEYTIYNTFPSQFDKIVLSTEDPDIIDWVSDFEPHITIQRRPEELATDTASKWDVFRYIAETNPQYDILVDLDTGCPLRSPKDITDCIEKLQTGYDVVVTAYEAERNPYFNMVRVGLTGQAFVVGDWGKYRDGISIVNRQQAPKVYSLSPSVFAIRRDALFKYDHWSRSNLGIVEIPRRRGIDIDTQDDWEYVEYLMKKG